MTTSAAPASARQIVLFSLLRMVVNAGLRLVNPFLAIFSAGMGVDIITLSFAISFANLASAFSPLLAPVAERYGRKTGMLLGMSLAVVGTGLLVIWPGYPSFFAFLLLINLGNNILTPTTQAYLGDHVPFARRGLAIAVNEMSWALSFILGMPLIGFLLARAQWYSPFWLLTGLGLLGLVFLLRLPADRPVETHSGSFFSSLGVVIRAPAARAGLLLGAALGCGVEVVALMFGVWMKDSFALSAVALGAASAVIGFAELSGELSAGGLTDRLGKKPSILLGLGVNILTALLLPLFGRSYIGALIWLALFFLSFEFCTIGSMTLMTEVLPEARAALMTCFFSVFSLGVARGPCWRPGCIPTVTG